jgi:hypothetical protein
MLCDAITKPRIGMSPTQKSYLVHSDIALPPTLKVPPKAEAKLIHGPDYHGQMLPS